MQNAFDPNETVDTDGDGVGDNLTKANGCDRVCRYRWGRVGDNADDLPDDATETVIRTGRLAITRTGRQ